MKFQEVDPLTITKNPWNSNKVSHENEQKLKSSIARNGMFKPILVRELEDGTLQSIGGEHRNEQAIELGLTTVPVINLGQISDDKAKEIGLADNARYGIDDTLMLNDILESMDKDVLQEIMPWTAVDMAAMTASLGVDIDNLDLDIEPVIPEDDKENKTPANKPGKTHQVLRFRMTIPDAARVSQLINKTMRDEGFTKEDDLTNSGDALAFVLFEGQDDVS